MFSASVRLSHRAFSTTAAASIKNVTVFGAGFMGNGIAQISAAAGYNVTLVDVNQAAAEKGAQSISRDLSRIAKKKFADQPDQADKFVKDIMARIKTSDNTEASVANTDLVVEAIIENLSHKQNLFRVCDAKAPKHAILASNTSSLRVTDIASVTNRKDRVGGLHFFSPVPVMKLVEVVRTQQTSNETHEALTQFGKNVGKITVSCKDTPGFVVNRLLVPLMMEAIRMLERGDATKEDIDNAMKYGANHPMGPLELADFVGLDVCHHIIHGWHADYPNEPLFNPSPLLDSLIQQKKFGRKTGEGFYSYEAKPAADKKK